MVYIEYNFIEDPYEWEMFYYDLNQSDCSEIK